MYLAKSGGGGGNLSFLLVILVLGLLYVLFIRNMRRKQQAQVSEQQNMRNSLAIGTEIVTIGGLYGTVVGVDDDTVTLEISDGVTARYDRNAIVRVITAVDEDPVDDDDESDDPDDESDSTDLDATANSIVEQKD